MWEQRARRTRLLLFMKTLAPIGLCPALEYMPMLNLLPAVEPGPNWLPLLDSFEPPNSSACAFPPCGSGTLRELPPSERVIDEVDGSGRACPQAGRAARSGGGGVSPHACIPRPA